MPILYQRIYKNCNIMDPWSINGLITPIEDLINLFQEWNKTKSSEKRLISYNRAKQWVCCLLKKPVSIPQVYLKVTKCAKKIAKLHLIT